MAERTVERAPSPAIVPAEPVKPPTLAPTFTKLKPAPGIYAGIPMDRYVRDAFLDGPPSLSSSIAHRLITRSPKHAWVAHPRLNDGWEDDRSRASDLGSAAHAVLLEGRREILTVVDSPDWKTKAAREQRDHARASGRVPILIDQADALEQMVDVARRKIARSPDLRNVDVDHLEAERTAVWRDGATWCRCRPDWLTPDRAVIFSYKTSFNAQPETFLRTALNLGYDLQAAFESRVIEILTGRLPHYIWLVSETEPPYAAALVGLSPMLLDLGLAKYRRAIALWAHCLATGEFPAYPDRICYVDPPAWAMAQWDERVAGPMTNAVDDGRDLADQLWGER